MADASPPPNGGRRPSLTSPSKPKRKAAPATLPDAVDCLVEALQGRNANVVARAVADVCRVSHGQAQCVLGLQAALLDPRCGSALDILFPTAIAAMTAGLENAIDYAAVVFAAATHPAFESTVVAAGPAGSASEGLMLTPAAAAALPHLSAHGLDAFLEVLGQIRAVHAAGASLEAFPGHYQPPRVAAAVFSAALMYCAGWPAHQGATPTAGAAAAATGGAGGPTPGVGGAGGGHGASPPVSDLSSSPLPSEFRVDGTAAASVGITHFAGGHSERASSVTRSRAAKSPAASHALAIRAAAGTGEAAASVRSTRPRTPSPAAAAVVGASPSKAAGPTPSPPADSTAVGPRTLLRTLFQPGPLAGAVASDAPLSADAAADALTCLKLTAVSAPSTHAPLETSASFFALSESPLSSTPHGPGAAPGTASGGGLSRADRALGMWGHAVRVYMTAAGAPVPAAPGGCLCPASHSSAATASAHSTAALRQSPAASAGVVGAATPSPAAAGAATSAAAATSSATQPPPPPSHELTSITLETVHRALSFVRLEPFPQYGYVQRQALLSQMRADAREAAELDGAVDAAATASVPAVGAAAPSASVAATSSPVIADASLRAVVQRSLCGLLALQSLQQEQLLAQPAVATQVSRQAARSGGKKGAAASSSRAVAPDADDDSGCIAAAAQPATAVPIDSRVISSTQVPTVLRAWAASMIQRKSLKDIVTFFTRPIESAVSLPHIDLDPVVEGLLASAKWDLARALVGSDVSRRLHFVALLVRSQQTKQAIKIAGEYGLNIHAGFPAAAATSCGPSGGTRLGSISAALEASVATGTALQLLTLGSLPAAVPAAEFTEATLMTTLRLQAKRTMVDGLLRIAGARDVVGAHCLADVEAVACLRSVLAERCITGKTLRAVADAFASAFDAYLQHLAETSAQSGTSEALAATATVADPILPNDWCTGESLLSAVDVACDMLYRKNGEVTQASASGVATPAGASAAADGVTAVTPAADGAAAVATPAVGAEIAAPSAAGGKPSTGGGRGGPKNYSMPVARCRAGVVTTPLLTLPSIAACAELAGGGGGAAIALSTSATAADGAATAAADCTVSVADSSSAAASTGTGVDGDVICHDVAGYIRMPQRYPVHEVSRIAHLRAAVDAIHGVPASAGTTDVARASTGPAAGRWAQPPARITRVGDEDVILVGIDCEWRGNLITSAASDEAGVATLQVSVGAQSWVVDMPSLHAEAMTTTDTGKACEALNAAFRDLFYGPRRTASAGSCAAAAAAPAAAAAASSPLAPPRTIVLVYGGTADFAVLPRSYPYLTSIRSLAPAVIAGCPATEALAGKSAGMKGVRTGASGGASASGGLAIEFIDLMALSGMVRLPGGATKVQQLQATAAAAAATSGADGASGTPSKRADKRKAAATGNPRGSTPSTPALTLATPTPALSDEGPESMTPAAAAAGRTLADSSGLATPASAGATGISGGGDDEDEDDRDRPSPAASGASPAAGAAPPATPALGGEAGAAAVGSGSGGGGALGTSAGSGAGGGLAGLCERVLGHPLNKYWQMSDWLRRPLYPGQREYAALDAWTLTMMLPHLARLPLAKGGR